MGRRRWQGRGVVIVVELKRLAGWTDIVIMIIDIIPNPKPLPRNRNTSHGGPCGRLARPCEEALEHGLEHLLLLLERRQVSRSAATLCSYVCACAC